VLYTRERESSHFLYLLAVPACTAQVFSLLGGDSKHDVPPGFPSESTADSVTAATATAASNSASSASAEQSTQ
jgi:hypothetical protein